MTIPLLTRRRWRQSICFSCRKIDVRYGLYNARHSHVVGVVSIFLAFLQLKHSFFLSHDWLMDLYFWRFPCSWISPVFSNKAFVCDVPEFYRLTSSLRRLGGHCIYRDFPVRHWIVQNDTISVSQLWGNELNNNNACNSSSKETFIDATD